MSAAVSIFDMKTSEEGTTARIAFYGELDLASARSVEEEIERLERGRPERLVLDLRGLTFMDSTGLRLITSADSRARQEGRRLTIIQGPEAVKRVFTITRLDERLDIVEDEPEAASGAS